MTATINTFSRIAIDDSSTSTISDFDANSFEYEMLTGSNIGSEQVHTWNEGHRGTRSRNAARVRLTRESIFGQLLMNPTPVELDQWLPRILGAAESTDVFALAETIPAWSALIDRGGYKRFVYTGCKVARCTIRGTSGGHIQWALDVVGLTETGPSDTSWPGTIPAINSGLPMIFSEATYALSADASATQVQEFEIVIDNVLDERFLNSVTRTEINALDRIITCRMVVPFTANEIDLYDQAVTGAAGTLTLTSGTTSTAFAFANLKSPNNTPPAFSRDEAMLTLNMMAYKSGSTNELIVTHDST